MIFKDMAQAANEIQIKIHHHPFNIQLAEGTLPQDIFIYYLIQDALYLADYSRALAMTAARLPHNHHTQQFIEFALGAIKAERELHLDYLSQASLRKYSSERVTEANPACFMYTNYLLRMASLASVEEAVASLLPCFFIYHEIGKSMTANLWQAHPYYNWIALYSSEEFETSVRIAIEITNDLGSEASETIRDKMIQAFVKSTQLEWCFWQSAYKLEKWY
ncbi:Thiaminase-2 [Legionella busanensis]|uniref:Thiaminase-2 n=1 Tax=Legionella busanensis TaxID=190655 RepID=A0A378JK62_9GAMM|nr:TenA family protein [Legionella busanensis]STX51078.1 Thiaminase-2 [Legionella busanensis]